MVLPFYAIKRDMYVPTEGNRAENDAEHSWSLAFMAFMLAPAIDKKLDVQKAVTYAIIHDLAEIHAGDTSVWAPEKDHASKDRREEVSLGKIKSDFANYPHLIKSLGDYRVKADAEAKFIYALDKFHNWLTGASGGGAFFKQHRKITKAQTDKRLKIARTKAYKHPKVGEYFDELVEYFDHHPEFFYPDNIKL